MTEFTVNGVAHAFDGDEDMPLLWYLRDEAGLTGTKYGCGSGLCGACTVHVDGIAAHACQTSIADTAGRAVVTIEGLSPAGSHPLQQAWAAHNVPQCGYCQAGQIMQAASLLQENPAISDADIAAGMYGNLCRCGTYQRIAQAIRAAREVMT